MHTRFAGSPTSEHNADHFVTVVHRDGQWEWSYDNNFILEPFEPRPTDLLVAIWDFTAHEITPLEGAEGVFQGVPFGYASGDLAFLVDMWNGQPNAGEAMVTGTGFTRHGPVVATHRVYDSFGNRVSETDASVAFDFGFQGREWDAEAGLAYHRARWVDPSVGRFISEDPIGLGDGPNRFRFAGNDPLNRIDPSGLTAAQQSPGVSSADRDLQQPSTGSSPGGFTRGGIDAILGGVPITGPTAPGSGGGLTSFDAFVSPGASPLGAGGAPSAGFMPTRGLDALVRQVRAEGPFDAFDGFGSAGFNLPQSFFQANVALFPVDGNTGLGFVERFADTVGTFQFNLSFDPAGSAREGGELLRSSVDQVFDRIGTAVGGFSARTSPLEGEVTRDIFLASEAPRAVIQSLITAGESGFLTVNDPRGAAMAIAADLQRRGAESRVVEANVLQSGGSPTAATFASGGVLLADLLGVRQVFEAATNRNVVTGESLGLSPFERGSQAAFGISKFTGFAAGALKTVKGLAQQPGPGAVPAAVGGTRHTIPTGRSAHIFRPAPGHLPDTPANRRLLQSVADDPSTTLGRDRFDNIWSARQLPDGTQVWTQTRNGQIINGGLNTIPRSFSPDSGLSNPKR